MNLFAGRIIPNELSRSNFDSLMWALCTIYQVVSLERWEIVTYLIKSYNHKYFIKKVYHKCLIATHNDIVVYIYFALLLFFGNFVLKNLFLAGVLGVFQTTRNEIKNRKIRAFSILKNFNLDKCTL